MLPGQGRQPWLQRDDFYDGLVHTDTRDAEGGQEGRGQTAQLQVCHGYPLGAILGMAKPQQLCGVLAELRAGPAFFVHADEVGGRDLGRIGPQPAELVFAPLTGAYDGPSAAVPDFQPRGIQAVVPGASRGLADDEPLGAMPSKAGHALTVGLQWPALFKEVALGFACCGNMPMLVAASEDYALAARGGVTQHDALDAHGGLECADELRGQRCGRPRGRPKAGACAGVT